YSKALEINPQYAEAYGNRGLTRLLQGKDAEAQKDFDKCFKLNSSLKADFEEAAKEIKEKRAPTKKP
ncbi:MAG TPA: tetratricopeptide repeat protein, partial [Pyrinomonadaceae bacterium]